MDEQELLKNMPKKTTRNLISKKYGMFGLSLGEDTYNRLDAYCKKHNVYKSSVVKKLVLNYLNKVERGENV